MEAPGNSWLDFKLNPQLQRAIQDLGFERPTEIQQKVVSIILGGQEVIGIAQTGTGKTAAYLLPLLKKVNYAQGNDPRALILAPTKELVIQIGDHAAALSKHTDLRMVVLYGGIGPKTQIKSLQTGSDVLIATPGRFLELYRRSEIQTKQIKTLVLDEADRMMEMGFMQQLRNIFEVIPSKRQNLLFSATFPPKVETLASEFLEFPVRVEVTPQSTPAKMVKQELIHTPNLKTKINLLDHTLHDASITRVMVFARTKQSADNILHYIDRKGLGPARVIHSNKGQNARINALNQFREGDLRVLVATDVAARGIDVPNVSLVINFDVPVRYEDYIHRIGRTGRAFVPGSSLTFVTETELYHIRRIETLIRQKIAVRKMPPGVSIEETPQAEAQAMNREIDRQKRLIDPTFKGAFHERKKKARGYRS